MVMPDTGRTRRAGGAQRIAVLEAVVGVLAERGYENTRFADVAAAAGGAISTLQNYFGSREDMLVEAMRDASHCERELLERLAAGEPKPWNRLVALVDRSLSTPLNVQIAMLEFWRCGIRDPEIREYGTEMWNNYSRAFVHTISDGIEDGVFTTPNRPEDVVELLLRTLSGALFPRVLGFPARSIKRFRQVLLADLAASLNVGNAGKK